MDNDIISLAEAEKIGFSSKTELRITFRVTHTTPVVSDVDVFYEFSSVAELRDTLVSVINSRILDFDTVLGLGELEINGMEVNLEEIHTFEDYASKLSSLFESYDASYLVGLADSDSNSSVIFNYSPTMLPLFVRVDISLSKFEYDRVRGFDLVSKYADSEFLLPERSTSGSAGYDLRSAERVNIQPKEIKLIPLGVKAYMQPNEVLYLYDRSSNPRKKGLVTINSVGIIDSDYYNNPDNEGLIYAQMMNITDEPITVDVGERLAQGIFMNFLTADGDSAKGVRVGGFGSTGS